MKESAKYLKFFQRNIFILLAPLLLSMAVSALVINNYPTNYQIHSIFQIDYNETNISQKVAVVDQAVILVRSRNIQLELGVNEGVKVNAVKNAPLSLLLITEGGNKGDVSKAALSTNDFLKLHFDMQEVGRKVEGVVSPPYFLIVSFALGLGFLIGLLISLAKEYFKNY